MLLLQSKELIIVYLLFAYCCPFHHACKLNPITSTISNSNKRYINKHSSLIIAENSIRPNTKSQRNNETQRSNQTTLKTHAFIQTLMFCYYASLGCTMPFIPIYYRYLGLSDHTIGLLGAITPSITFLVSPLWGALADETGKFKEIMITTFVLSFMLRYLLIYKEKNIYFISCIILLTAIFNAPVKPLMDSAVMDLLANKNDYGKSRFFGQVGFGIGSYAVGTLVHSEHTVHKIFNVHVALSIPTLFIMLFFGSSPKIKKILSDTLDLRKRSSSTKPTTAVSVTPKHDNFIVGIRKAFQNSEVCVFFFIVFFIGVSSGIIENYCIIRMSEISGKNKNVLGLSRLLSSLAGGPMFWLSGQILELLGINRVLTLSLFSYFVRFMTYSFMTNPWQALPAEILRGITFAVFWSAATSFVYKTSPKGHTATMLGLLNGMYGGLGQSVGAVVGGSLSRKIGIVNTFFIAGFADMIAIFCFVLYQLHTTSHWNSKNQTDKEERERKVIVENK